MSQDGQFKDTSGPAFPVDRASTGFTRREFYALNAPRPSRAAMKQQFDLDAFINPHGDTYRPSRRSALEIEWDLRFAWADAAIAASTREPR